MGYINHTMKSVIIHYVNFDKRKYNFLEFPRYRVSRKKKKKFLVQETLKNLGNTSDIL